MSHFRSRVGELKSQGAAEAAQNPDSTVSAEDAENVMTNESKKAGVAAFQFDPDASPEEKAAQARSVGGIEYPYFKDCCVMLTLVAYTSRLPS